MSLYSRGHSERIDAHRPLPFSLSPHVHLGAEALPDEVDLTPFIPFNINQNGSGICYSAAPAGAIETTLAANGIQLLDERGEAFHISVLDLANLVHAIERASSRRWYKLWDCGGDPADVLTAISQWGVRRARYTPGTDEAERNCDASPRTVGPDHEPVGDEEGGAEPNLADLITDSKTIFVGAHEIYDFDPIAECRKTLANKSCITVAWCVLDADETAGPDAVLDGRVGIPDHDSYLCGYRRMPDGSFRFRLKNSWDPNWADRGLAWVTESFVKSATSRYAMNVRRMVAAIQDGIRRAS